MRDSDLLDELAAARARIADLAHTLVGDDMRPAQAALVDAVGVLDDLAARVRTPAGVVAPVPGSQAPPPREPGVTTVERRIRANAGRHRSRA